MHALLPWLPTPLFCRELLLPGLLVTAPRGVAAGRFVAFPGENKVRFVHIAEFDERALAAHRDRDLSVLEALECPRDDVLAAQGILQLELRVETREAFVVVRVVKSALDTRRADLEPVAPIDAVSGVESRRKVARNLRAKIERHA